MPSDYLSPPQPGFTNPDHIVPLSPPIRPPFAHYHSSSTLPPTPHTPYPLPPGDTTESSGLGTEQTTGLRPYLTLPPRLLLTTLSPALLPLILTIAHLIQNRSSTASLAESLKTSLLSACTGLAKGAAHIQTLPRYLAMQTNEEAIRATQASILAIGSALIAIITIIEVVVEFMVDTYRSMLLCTIELAVRGTLEVLVAGVQTISEGITTSLNAVRTNIQNDVASANTFIQEAVARINSVTSLVNVNLSVPQFTIPSLSSLQNVKVPTDFQDSLVKLNSTIPSLSVLKDKMNALLEVPFEGLKAEINETRLEMAASFNASILPTPSLSTLSAQNANLMRDELCGDLDTSIIDDTTNALHHLSNIAIGLMILLLFLTWAALCIWEWRRWRATRQTVEEVEREWEREGSRDAWRVVAIVENPVLERYGSRILERVAPSPRTKTNLRWLCAYLAHPTCLALLFIASLGFLSLQFQLVALDAIKTHARENANSSVASTSSSLTTKLNAMAAGSSAEYARDFNSAIDRYQKRIDEELFGNWLNTTAVSLNATMVDFYDEIEKALNATFGGTILYNPFNTFMYCILGSKIDNLEKGLTWLHDHAHIDLPRLPDDILMLSNESMSELTAPVAAAAVGSGSSDNGGGVVGDLITHFEKALVVERNFYAILLEVWLGFALIGVLVVLWHSGGSDRYYSWRGRDSDQTGAPVKEDGGGGGRWPWIKEEHPIYDTYSEKVFRGTTPANNNIIPRIVEPGGEAGYSEKDHNYTDHQPHQRTGSFLDYPGDQSTLRPFVPRKGTFGSTISSLAAPGQAFLIFTRGKSDDGTRAPDDHDRLVDAGTSSEKYNHHSDSYTNANAGTRGSESGMGTPPPFWVNKFYGAVEGVKALFPTRGQKHGEAVTLGRGTSQRTEKSFGASRQPSATTPGEESGWPHDHGREQWSYINPETIGRAIDGSAPSNPFADNEQIIDGRYPPHPAAHPMYPRPLSRAPTLAEGKVIPRTVAPSPTPPMPLAKDENRSRKGGLGQTSWNGGNEGKKKTSAEEPGNNEGAGAGDGDNDGDSIDYLDSSSEAATESAEIDPYADSIDLYRHTPQHRHQHHYQPYATATRVTINGSGSGSTSNQDKQPDHPFRPQPRNPFSAYSHTTLQQPLSATSSIEYLVSDPHVQVGNASKVNIRSQDQTVPATATGSGTAASGAVFGDLQSRKEEGVSIRDRWKGEKV